MLLRYEQDVKDGYWDWLNKPENKVFKPAYDMNSLVGEVEKSTRQHPLSHTAITALAEDSNMHVTMQQMKHRRATVAKVKADYKKQNGKASKKQLRSLPIPPLGAYEVTSFMSCSTYSMLRPCFLHTLPVCHCTLLL